MEIAKACDLRGFALSANEVPAELRFARRSRDSSLIATALFDAQHLNAIRRCGDDIEEPK